MAEIFRSRDCVVFIKDSAYTVAISDEMVAGGWPGGQGVQWSGSVRDEFQVTYARGKSAGFLVWGSNEIGDDFTSMTRNQPHWRFATMIEGSALMATSSFERYTISSRLGGPLVPISYSVNQPLYFSLRGLWTNEDELTIISDPQAPSVQTGYVVQPPKVTNLNFLSIQTTL